MKTTQLEPLQSEANEIVAMTVASIKTLRNKPETKSKITNRKS